MIPSEMLSLVRSQLYEQSDDFWTDAELYGYMTQAQTEIAKTLLDTNSMDSSNSYANISTVMYPSNLLYLKSVTYNYNLLERITQDNYNKMYEGINPSDNIGTPKYYIQSNGYLDLVPTPSTSGKNITMRYISDPSSITSTSIEFGVNARYHDIIFNYTLFRAISKDSDDTRSNSFYQQYQIGMNEARSNQNIYDTLNNTFTVRDVN